MQFSLILVRFRKSHKFDSKLMIEGDLSPQFNCIIKFNIDLLYDTFPSFRRGLEVDLSLQYRVKIEDISKVEDEKI